MCLPSSSPAGTGPGLAFSPDGKVLAAPSGGTGGRTNTIALYDTVTGKLLRKIESPWPVSSFAFSPDGRTLAAEEHAPGLGYIRTVLLGRVQALFLSVRFWALRYR